VVTESAVASVSRNGREIHRDSAVDGPLRSIVINKQAAERPIVLEGHIVDSAGAPIPNALLQVALPGRVAFTAAAGSFRLSSLPPGLVHLRVSADGYLAVAFDLAVRGESVRRLRIVLPLRPER